ncbi:MAG: hypothetical protein ACYS7Y_33505 [Planctomycetota bacterium]|jgi:hypothetical protein
MIYDFDSDKHACNVTVEIDYDIDRGDHFEWGGHRYKHDDEIALHEVRVLHIEGYDADGEVVYELERDEITESWLPDLDAAVYQWVSDDINDWGPIGDALWEESGR